MPTDPKLTPAEAALVEALHHQWNLAHYGHDHHLYGHGHYDVCPIRPGCADARDALCAFLAERAKGPGVEPDGAAQPCGSRKHGDYLAQIRELEATRTAARRQVTVLRTRVEALEGALRELHSEHEAWQVDWPMFNRESPDFDPTYKPKFTEATKKAAALLRGGKGDA